jgi:drug/metabolite transporter (DMT)-like permease
LKVRTVRAFGTRLWNAAVPLLLVTVLLWAGNSIVGRLVRDDVPPLTLAFGRWLGALLLLLPFAYRHVRADAAVLRRHWKMTLLLGLLGVSCFNAFLYSALHYTTASNAMLLQSVQPALILGLSALFFGERTGPARIVAVSLSIIGAAVVVTRGEWQALADMRFNRGEILMLVAVGCWSLYTALLRLRPMVNGLSFLAVTFATGALTMLPLSALELARGGKVVVSATSVGTLLYVAIFPSLVAYLLYNRSVELIGGARAGQFINLMPIAGAGLAVVLLGEPFEAYHAVGGALILAGVILFMRGGRNS